MPIDSFSGKYDFLSNFYFCKIGEYKSVEHAFQALKTHDPSWRKLIKSADTPAEAKKLGRKAPLRDDWERVKLRVMEAALREKFKPHTELAIQLMLTDPHELIEGNWWGDRYWGVCKGYGQNHLGQLLMKIRKELIDE